MRLKAAEAYFQTTHPSGFLFPGRQSEMETSLKKKAESGYNGKAIT